MVICHGMASLIEDVSNFSAFSASSSLASYFLLYIAVALLSLVFGYVLSLLIERPFMNLAKRVPPFYKLYANGFWGGGNSNSKDVPLTASVTAASLGGRAVV